MHHTGTIAFETERLLCRPFKQEDCADMLKNWIANLNVQSEYGEPVYTTMQEVETNVINLTSCQKSRNLLK